jgi:hypothetical protein
LLAAEAGLLWSAKASRLLWSTRRKLLLAAEAGLLWSAKASRLLWSTTEAHGLLRLLLGLLLETAKATGLLRTTEACNRVLLLRWLLAAAHERRYWRRIGMSSCW